MTYRPNHPNQRERDASFTAGAFKIDLPLGLLVPDMSLSPHRQNEPILFALCLYGEARGESEEGILEVAKVIMNRVCTNRSQFGMNVREVILKHDEKGVYQFSWMNPMDVNFKKLVNPDRFYWFKCAKIGLPVYLRPLQPSPDNCLYYQTKTLADTWLSRNMSFVKTIGNHDFYAEKS